MSVLVFSIIGEVSFVGTKGCACALRTSVGNVGECVLAVFLSVLLVGVSCCVCTFGWLASQLFSLLARLSVMRIRFVLAAADIGAACISFFALAIVALGIGDGPLA